MKNLRKVIFMVWFFSLWGTVTYALFECFGYQGTYYMGPSLFLPLIWMAISFMLLLGIGVPLFLYFRKRELRRTGTVILTVVLLASTIFLANSLVQPAIISAANKSKVQWYIDDLKSQGFNVEYLPSYGGKVFATQVNSYSEIIGIASEFNATAKIYGGVPNYFIFFVPSNIIIQGTDGNRTYRYWASW